MVGRPNKQGENFNYINVSRLKSSPGFTRGSSPRLASVIFIGLE